MILELPDLGIHDIINDSEKRDELSASGLQILVESVHQGMNADLIPQIQETIRADVRMADSKEERDALLGDKLYAVISESEPEEAGKLTGMLLEMEDDDVIRLLCNPPALTLQLLEAKRVLKKDNPIQARTDSEEQSLGDQLFALVQAANPQKAGKLTGMLLELGDEEVKKLLHSPKLLKEKIKEAEEVLHNPAEEH